MATKKFTGTGYVCSGVATEKFGIEFRSKLEAEWAYFFDKNNMDWTYADKESYDFVVNGVCIEIKPLSIHLVVSATQRMGDVGGILILAGSPKKYVKVWASKFMEDYYKLSIRTPSFYCFEEPDTDIKQKETAKDLLASTTWDASLQFASPELWGKSASSIWDHDDPEGFYFDYGNKGGLGFPIWRIVVESGESSGKYDRNNETSFLVYSEDAANSNCGYGMQCSEHLLNCSPEKPSGSSIGGLMFLIRNHEGLLDELKQSTEWRDSGRRRHRWDVVDGNVSQTYWYFRKKKKDIPWKSVTDSMPIEGKDVLVMLQDGDKKWNKQWIAKYDPVQGWKGVRQCGNEGLIDYAVTHWAELPEGPK